MTNLDKAGLQAAILSCISSGPKSISDLEAALSPAKRSSILTQVRDLRAKGEIEMIGDKRGAKYAAKGLRVVAG